MIVCALEDDEVELGAAPLGRRVENYSLQIRSTIELFFFKSFLIDNENLKIYFFNTAWCDTREDKSGRC